MNATTMQTYTGKKVDLANFSVEDVRLPDIAHALSILNRFTGHSKVPYSVAQHSVMVSRMCEPENSLWGLLHDASEAYLGDMATPLKTLIPQYRELEEHVQKTIAQAFFLPWPIPPDVKIADLRALMGEKRDIIPCGVDWGIDIEPACEAVSPCGWQEAKQMFESRYKEIMR